MPDRRKLILVDDCRTEAMLVEEAVEASGAFEDFLHVVDSRQASAVIDAQKPDAVLLDLRMPGLSGWEVLGQLKETELLASTFVAVLSNSSSLADRREARERGANAYFVKPMDSNGYIQIVEDVATALD